MDQINVIVPNGLKGLKLTKLDQIGRRGPKLTDLELKGLNGPK